jgi:hypothetical protein
MGRLPAPAPALARFKAQELSQEQTESRVGFRQGLFEEGASSPGKYAAFLQSVRRVRHRE